MSGPRHFAFAVNDKRARDTVPTISFHVAGVGLSLVIAGDDIIHAVAHFLHKRFYDRWFFVADSDKHYIFARELLLELRQMGDTRATGTAPGGPELDNINLVAFGDINGPTFDPFLDFQRRGGIANLCRVGRL